MKKQLTAFLSFVLTLALVFTLVACADKEKTPDNKNNSSSVTSQGEAAVTYQDASNALIGEWKGETADLYDDYSEMKYGVQMSFNDDGTYSIIINAEEKVRAEVDIEIKHFAHNESTFEDYLANSGYNSIEEYISARVENFDPQNLIVRGTYYFDGNKFTMDGAEMNFEFTDDGFKFSDDNGWTKLKKVQ